MALAFVMMVGEIVGGTISGSMALKADGWHMGTHVGALGLTLVAYWYARTRAGNDAFSFGTGKVYALAGFTSGIVLVLVALWLGVESLERLIEAPPVNYNEALPIAIIGLVVNGVSAVVLGQGHHYGHSHGDHSHGGHAHGGHARGRTGTAMATVTATATRTTGTATTMRTATTTTATMAAAARSLRPARSTSTCAPRTSTSSPTR